MAKSKPSLKSNDLTGFLRAVTDEWKEIEHVYEVRLEMVIEPAGRGGILRISLTALDPARGHVALVNGYYQCEYPTAQVESLEACLYRCCIRLERVLRDARSHPMGKA